MKPMRWKMFLLLLLSMFCVGMLFRYLNTKPNGVINQVIISVRRVADADRSENFLEKDARIGNLEMCRKQLDWILQNTSPGSEQRDQIAVLILTQLVEEDVLTLEKAALNERVEHMSAERLKSVRAVNISRQYISAFTQHFIKYVNEEQSRSIAATFEERFRRAVAELKDSEGGYDNLDSGPLVSAQPRK